MAWRTNAYGEKTPTKCYSFYCCKDCENSFLCNDKCNGNCFNCSKRGRTMEKNCGTHDGGWDDM